MTRGGHFRHQLSRANLDAASMPTQHSARAQRMTDERFPRRDFLKVTASTALTFGAGLPATAQTSASAPPSPAPPFSTARPADFILKFFDRPGDRHRRRADRRRRRGCGNGGACRTGDPHHRSEGQVRHPRSDRRSCSHGSRGPQEYLSFARARAFDPRRPGPHRRPRAQDQARRVDRHHADRRSAVLLQRTGGSRRKAMAKAPRSRCRRPQQSRIHPLDLGFLASHLAAGVLRQ